MRPSASLLTELSELQETLRREFDRLNREHFGGRLTVPEIAISSRKTFGGYYQPGRHRIVVSWQAYREHGLEETLNTFRHEVAHIVHPNHSPAFWTLARRLGVTCRYASAPLHPKPPRYIYACPACGKWIARRRRLKLASCASCDSAYNPRFTLSLLSENVSAPGSMGTSCST